MEKKRSDRGAEGTGCRPGDPHGDSERSRAWEVDLVARCWLICHCAQGTRKQKRVCFSKLKNSVFVCSFCFVAEGKQEGLWEGSGHSGGGHAGTRHE